MRHFVIGLLIGLVIWPVAFYCYFRFGHVPVAVADGPLPFEGQIVQEPLGARSRGICRKRYRCNPLRTIFWQAPRRTPRTAPAVTEHTANPRASGSKFIRMLRSYGRRMARTM